MQIRTLPGWDSAGSPPLCTASQDHGQSDRVLTPKGPEERCPEGGMQCTQLGGHAVWVVTDLVAALVADDDEETALPQLHAVFHQRADARIDFLPHAG